MKKMHAPKIMVCSIAILSVAGCGGGCVASISCLTSSLLKTVGNFLGTGTVLTLSITSGRFKDLWNKNVKPDNVALMVMLDVPCSANVSWNWRNSSAVASSGERFKKVASFFTPLM